MKGRIAYPIIIVVICKYVMPHWMFIYIKIVHQVSGLKYIANKQRKWTSLIRKLISPVFS